MIQDIELARIHSDPRSSNEWTDKTFNKLKNNIELSGFVPPLVLMPHPSIENEYRLLDGHLRLAVLKACGWSKVPSVICTPRDETEVELLLVTLNSLRGTENIKKRAMLMDSLCQVIPVSDLSQLVPEDVNQIQDLLALAKLEFDELEKSILEQMKKAEANLPVPYHFMITAEEAQVVNAALQKAQSFQNTKKKDLSQAFVTVCKAYLTQHSEVKDAQEEKAP
jgi:hypothetical protein